MMKIIKSFLIKQLVDAGTTGKFITSITKNASTGAYEVSEAYPDEVENVIEKEIILEEGD